ncbi:syndecan-2 isoform X1 [Gadus macrocephalus]|uniref:syndecan-2 isoform X1 n=1 Tax=Gadus macrocephalus TaxID=80720 RepID=UPI0028CB6358|nr:syndecan-2 isoform X1 [Gadus macrocephalus]
MRSIWIVFLIGLATGYLSEKLLVSSQTSPGSDDMYLEGQSSGGIPSDDEDDENNISGSGMSEFDTTEIPDIMNKTRSLDFKTVTPDGTLATTNSPTMMQDGTTPAYMIQAETEVTGLEASEEPEIEPDTAVPVFPTTCTEDCDTRGGVTSDDDIILPEESDRVLSKAGSREEMIVEPEFVSDNMWQRTEVLAAVIACGVVGFLCALFLVLFIAYRMKKKDEGSYALGIAKVPPSAYQKQPPKEFYA